MTKTERAIEHFEGMVRLAKNRHPHPELEFWQAALDALRFQQKAEKNELNSEMRLIDANALREKATYAKVYYPEMLVVGLGYVLDAPTVDPVIHAHWIEDGDYQTCSHCGEEHSWVDYRAPYCETCGAKMDEGVNDG